MPSISVFNACYRRNRRRNKNGESTSHKSTARTCDASRGERSSRLTLSLKTDEDMDKALYVKESSLWMFRCSVSPRPLLQGREQYTRKKTRRQRDHRDMMQVCMYVPWASRIRTSQQKAPNRHKGGSCSCRCLTLLAEAVRLCRRLFIVSCPQGRVHRMVMCLRGAELCR